VLTVVCAAAASGYRVAFTGFELIVLARIDMPIETKMAKTKIVLTALFAYDIVYSLIG